MPTGKRTGNFDYHRERRAVWVGSEILPCNRSPTDPSEELSVGVFNVQRAWHSQHTGFLKGLPIDRWLCTYSSPTTRDGTFEGPISGL